MLNLKQKSFLPQFLVLWCLSDAQTLVANNVVCTANFLLYIKKFPKSSQTVFCYVPKFGDLTDTITHCEKRATFYALWLLM